MRDIVRYYTREPACAASSANYQDLPQVVKMLVAGDASQRKVAVTARSLDKFLGVRRYTYGMAEKNNQVGQVTGLAWTEVGGELLTIESSVMTGKRQDHHHRQARRGDAESIQAALSVAQPFAQARHQRGFLSENDIHIHLPRARRERCPSAGIGIVTAMVSALTGIPARADVAMTGETALRGEVLQIGGGRRTRLRIAAASRPC